jgi:hypothetical protein
MNTTGSPSVSPPMSLVGTKQTSRDVRLESAIGDKAEAAFGSREVRF